MKAAAIQLQPAIGDVAANLTACERLADEAGGQGAEWILLPEFFSTGMGLIPDLASGALPPDGAATELLQKLARRHSACVGGSFLCLDDDGHVRNAFFLATPDGLAGRHDKDLPTMWENCHYVGGSDDGVLESEGLSIGAALCLEFNRTQTVERLRGRVDLVVGGSYVWDPPDWMPSPVRRWIWPRHRKMITWSPRFARLVGAPVIEATHCGRLECATPGMPFTYRCELGNDAVICDAEGGVLARRGREEGPGVVVADIEPGRVPPLDDPPDRFWIEPLDPISEYIGWRYQNLLGKRWYRRHGPGAQRRSAANPARSLERVG